VLYIDSALRGLQIGEKWPFFRSLLEKMLGPKVQLKLIGSLFD
jgi:hypothetical protein